METVASALRSSGMWNESTGVFQNLLSTTKPGPTPIERAAPTNLYPLVRDMCGVCVQIVRVRSCASVCLRSACAALWNVLVYALRRLSVCVSGCVFVLHWRVYTGC